MEDVVFDNGTGTAWLYKEKGINYLYKHRFGIRRFYDGMPEGVGQSDKEAGLIEVVMIDLKVLQRKAADKQDGHATADAKVLLEAISLMEEVYHVDLTSYEKGLSNKMGLMDVIERQKNKLKEQKMNLRNKRMNSKRNKE